MLYGISAGAVFALAVPALGYGSAGLAATLGLAVADAAVLTLVGMVFWMKVVLAMDPEPQQAATFGVFHLAYGLVLGAFVYYVPLD